MTRPGNPEDQSRSVRKRDAIVEAAAAAFLAYGYSGTSMDDIAARAQVSKQTVYKHFTDKHRLFVEVVIAMVDDVGDQVYEEVIGLRDSGDIRADLRDLARRQLAQVMQPRLLRLRRLIISEADRFPELGRAFNERSPGRTVGALTAAFEDLTARNMLRIEDGSLAAEQFNWLVMSAPMNQAMLLGKDKSLAKAELECFADGAVATFIAAFGMGHTGHQGRSGSARTGRAPSSSYLWPRTVSPL